MSIQTNLSVSPYFDDYDPEKDYYKILFRPGVAVQVRELNQLQTILQNQIEKFGDHILRRGTIINGCQPSFQTSVPYVKILDTTDVGAAVDVNDYLGLSVRNSSNLVSKIIDVRTGFEAQDPNLNTLYLKYLNSGNNQDEIQYASGSLLTIYNNDYRIYGIGITNASQGFSNNDLLVVLSAVEVQNTTGGLEFSNNFAVGETITQDTTSAQAEIISVDTTANNSAYVLKIKPLTSQLAIKNTASWAFEENYNITCDTSGVEAVITGFVGNNANASFKTTTAGSINTLELRNTGEGYYVIPHVTISSTSATQSEINTLDLTPRNYRAKVTVADVDNPVGVGYMMNVTEGNIYQKGHFLRVKPQSVIVQKYANTPDAVSVGFVTNESVVNNALDFTLVDNASGFLNENAPGANRLKLEPVLSLKTFEEADEDVNYYPIFKFSGGKYYSQMNSPQYNKIADELARRTFEESGNYVLDPFRMSTRSRDSMSNTETEFVYVIDPGHAYIGGYRVETLRNYAQSVSKAITTETVANNSIDLNYGNYIRVKEFAGLHAFSTASQISLRDTAAQYLTTNGDTITAPGNEIGKARIRSVVHETGTQGTPAAIYRIYLFDIRMNSGKTFSQTRSVYADNASIDGIADLILEPSAGANPNNIAVIKEVDKNRLIFNLNEPIKSISNIKYTYRTIESHEVSTAGVVTIPAQSGAEWPYTGALNFAEENQLIIVPEEDLVSTSTLTGTGSSGSSGTLDGSGTSFVTELNEGDHIEVDDGGSSSIVLVDKIDSDTELKYLPTDGLSGVTVSGASISKAYPTNIPIPFAERTDTSATVVGTNLVLDLDIALSAAANVSVTFNQRYSSATPVTKDVNRKCYVKIQANTHPNGTTGPWCLGHSDVFRLRGVYAGTTTSDSDITNYFNVDNKHYENYHELSELYLKSKSYTIGDDDVILVEFDVLRHNIEGLKVINSYNINDGLTLDEMDVDGTVMHTLEIPEFYDSVGNYYDLRDCLDFRPISANTVVVEQTAASAPTNPSSAVDSTRFSNDGKKFPVPNSDMFFDYEYYLPREDVIVLNYNGSFDFLVGREFNGNPDNQLPLFKTNIPPYPSLPEVLSFDVAAINTRLVTSGTKKMRRSDVFRIKSYTNDVQPAGYTMQEIGQLERRIQALEYYATLSELEDGVKNRSISSSVDSTLERFKFGFFADNFADYSYTDINSDELNSTIYEFNLQPARNLINLDLRLKNNLNYLVDDSNYMRFPYTKKAIISQKYATTGPIVKSTSGGDDSTVTPPRQSIVEVCRFQPNLDGRYDPDDFSYYEESIYTLSANSEADGRSIKISFDLYAGVDRFEFSQSTSTNGPWVSIGNTSTLSASNLTEDEKRTIKNKAYTQKIWDRRDGSVKIINNSFSFSDRINVDPNFSYSAYESDPQYFVENVGRYNLTYDFSKGRYLRVRVVKGSSNFGYEICYPIDSVEDPITSNNVIYSTGDLLLRSYCDLRKDLIGVYDDGAGGTYERIINKKDKETCGYVEPPPQSPDVVVNDNKARTSVTLDAGEKSTAPVRNYNGKWANLPKPGGKFGTRTNNKFGN